MTDFKALYLADRLHVVNPAGDTGLITLWSPVRTVLRKLGEEAPALLDAGSSRIAVVANLYGDGMFAMFCNLLYNPQIRHLVAVGQDLGLPTGDEIAAFLEHGIEDAELLGRPVRRIRGTTRVLPAAEGFDADRLRAQLTYTALGRLSSEGLAGRLVHELGALPGAPPGAPQDRVRVAIDAQQDGARRRRPSDIAAHQVARRTPLECWVELLVRCARFGRLAELGNGPRLELLNVKAVIADPRPDSAEALAALGIDRPALTRYEAAVLQPRLPEGVSYTYGNRLRGYFPQRQGTDTLASVIEELSRSPTSRRAYVALWDSSADLTAALEHERSTPCLVALAFRLEDGALALSATYRAHNLLEAWLGNVYGLMAIQRHVAEALTVESGPLTVVSHSLGLDPQSPRFELVRGLDETWTTDDDVDRATGKVTLREDPSGYFAVSVDRGRGEIVAQHQVAGVTIKEYRGARAVTLTNEIAADMAVSYVSHALWLGRELQRHESLLTREAADATSGS